MRLQTTKNMEQKFSQVRGKIKNKYVVHWFLSHDDNVFNLAVLEPKVNKANTSQDYKASQMNIKLDQVSVVDKINLNKQICKVIFSYCIQSIVNITKLKAQMVKLQRQLMQEKTKNKSCHVRNAELQQNIIILVISLSETKHVVDLLKEKEEEVQRLKNKL